MVARVLPQFLDDFFPPQDVMNKVIGEFLSSQQPYPQLMATVVYQVRGWGGVPSRAPGPQLLPQLALTRRPRPAASSQVFQTLHSAGQSSTVRDWVMLSLSNFTQRSPVAMAMWSLSCFFVSASTSPWVSAMYPCLVLVSILVDVCVSILETQVL